MDKKCVLAFTSIYIDPTGDVRPCCIAKTFNKKLNWKQGETLEDLYNAPQFKELRKSMVEGTPLSICDVCYKGAADLKDHWNKQWVDKLHNPNLYDKDYNVEKVSYVDARFSNICNFKCRMCSPDLSSSWYEDFISIAGQAGKEYIDRMEDIGENPVDKFTEQDIANIEHINVAGGEPFITADFFKLIDRITPNQASKVTMFVNTNLSTLFYKKRNIIEILSKFKSVHLSCSCDGYGEIGEYQRTGFSSKKFFDNLKMLKSISSKYSNIVVGLEYTITTLNMFHIFDFLDYIDSDTPLNRDAVHFHWANGPAGFAPAAMPSKLKEKVTDYITSNLEKEINQNYVKGNLEPFINYINKETEESYIIKVYKNPKDLFVKLDELRGTDYRELFPWMDEIFKHKSLF